VFVAELADQCPFYNELSVSRAPDGFENPPGIARRTEITSRSTLFAIVTREHLTDCCKALSNVWVTPEHMKDTTGSDLGQIGDLLRPPKEYRFQCGSTFPHSD
jgi:hypothetical protein